MFFILCEKQPSVIRNAVGADGVVTGLTVPPLALGLNFLCTAPLALCVVTIFEERWPTGCQLELVSVEALSALLAHRETAAFGASISLCFANIDHTRLAGCILSNVTKLESTVFAVKARPRLEFPLLRFLFFNLDCIPRKLFGQHMFENGKLLFFRRNSLF